MSVLNFPKKEKEILHFWKTSKIFEKSLDARRKAKRFVFFEGPPTANGKPGVHHFLGRSFKDLYGRYKTMRGFYVLRKAGWDTHGLPVEIEIEKELGFKNKKDIEHYGVEKFNKKAKESVWKYKAEWEKMTNQMGFWLDMSDPYITYENNYIESLWAIIKKIWDKKLLYLAHKVVPFCVRCGTPISSHEVAQGYRRITDKSVFVKFKVKSLKFKDAYILAWTTTPWTLPGNVALAVGESIKYQVVSIKEKDEKYILAKDRVNEVIKEEHKVISEITGKDLVGLEYKPLFKVKELKSDKSYKVYDADFVSTVEGTGVVHTAVMYGEDDYELGTKVGLPKFHTVNEAGKFVHVDDELNGLYVKDKKTDDLIIKRLEKNDNLFKIEDYEHDYPFCWRCDEPLLYYAKNSWFIKMSALRGQLLKNNQKINWVPAHMKEGRFGQWLSEVKDWALSRERYWGTPLPVWECSNCEEKKVIGSLEDLENNSVGRGNKYFLLRHSLSTRDEESSKTIISSNLEKDHYHLTEKGKKKAQETAEKLVKMGEVDLIYSSPFLRTLETAEIAAKLLHIDIHKDDRLREVAHGASCEGKDHTTCSFKDERDTLNRKHDDGESWNDVRKRIVDFMNDIDSKHTGKRILIVSHGDPLFLLKFMAGGLSGSEAITAKRKKGHSLYPQAASLAKMEWKHLPRDEYGELDFHRPFIDKIYLKCTGCKAVMKKVPDLVDAWFDSGAMPFAQWHWPFENKKIFEEQFPADFIVEGVDQTRGWFYTLLATSTLLNEGAPYKNVISLGHVLDDKGLKMSKSKGNVISPFEVMDRYGADAARWYFYTINSPGESKLFSMKDVESQLYGFISSLQNSLRFYELYSSDQELTTDNQKSKNLLDKWILSRLNRLIMRVTDGLDKYEVTQSARAIEKFVINDLSNWWLRRSRKRKEALGMLKFLLFEISKIVAPFMPFSAEDIWRRLTNNQQPTTNNPESVHLSDWPKVNKKAIDDKLEKQMEEVKNIVTSGLAQRKKKQIKVRQPLRSVTVSASKNYHLDLEKLILDELNVKEIKYDTSQKELILDTELDQSLINEGYARELIRQIQDMRKEAKYSLDDRVYAQWHSSDKELSGAINHWSDEIKKETLLNKFVNSPHDDKVYDIEKEVQIAPGRKVWIGIKK